MNAIWPLAVISFYIICNAKNILVTLRGGRVSLKSVIVLALLVVAFVVILKLPSFLRGVVGCSIATAFATVFSIFDIKAFVTTRYFNYLEIVDFVVAVGSFIGIFLSKIAN